MVAKPSHAMYGSRRRAVHPPEMAINSRAVQMANVKRATETTNPRRNLCRPKKIGAHARFRTAWMAYTSNARRVVAASGDIPNARADATPIMAYSVLHTGAKTLFGGDHDGLSRLAYQGSRFFTTNTAPEAPAPTVPMTHAGVAKDICG